MKSHAKRLASHVPHALLQHHVPDNGDICQRQRMGREVVAITGGH
jgi:hypothetical protein